MENPMTWGIVEKVIDSAITEHRKAMDEHVSGLSLVRTIADALRAQGLIKETAE